MAGLHRGQRRSEGGAGGRAGRAVRVRADPDPGSAVPCRPGRAGRPPARRFRAPVPAWVDDSCHLGHEQCTSEHGQGGCEVKSCSRARALRRLGVATGTAVMRSTSLGVPGRVDSVRQQGTTDHRDSDRPAMLARSLHCQVGWTRLPPSTCRSLRRGARSGDGDQGWGLLGAVTADRARARARTPEMIRHMRERLAKRAGLGIETTDDRPTHPKGCDSPSPRAGAPMPCGTGS